MFDPIKKILILKKMLDFQGRHACQGGAWGDHGAHDDHTHLLHQLRASQNILR